MTSFSYIWKECLFARIRKKTHVFQLDDTHEMVTITKKLGGGGVHDYRYGYTLMITYVFILLISFSQFELLNYYFSNIEIKFVDS